MGAALFERTNGGTHVTAVGQEFVASAKRILEETEAMADRVKRYSSGQDGRLSVGIHASPSAGNFRATLVEYRSHFPDVILQLNDGPSERLIADLSSSAIDVAFVVGDSGGWEDKLLPVWSERIVVAVPESHPFSRQDIVRWDDLRHETLLVPQNGPGPEFVKLLVHKIGCSDPCRLLRQDAGLDRILTLVGTGWGLLLALEGATGAGYPGVAFREVHDSDGPTRLTVRALWRQANSNPSLRVFLQMLRERYPDLSVCPGTI